MTELQLKCHNGCLRQRTHSNNVIVFLHYRVHSVWIPNPNGEPLWGSHTTAVLHHWSSAAQTTAGPAPQLPHTHHRGRGDAHINISINYRVHLMLHRLTSKSCLNIVGSRAERPVRFPPHHTKRSGP